MNTANNPHFFRRVKATVCVEWWLTTGWVFSAASSYPTSVPEGELPIDIERFPVLLDESVKPVGLGAMAGYFVSDIRC